jgi:hypothetical protein
MKVKVAFNKFSSYIIGVLGNLNFQIRSMIMNERIDVYVLKVGEVVEGVFKKDL